MALKKEGYVSKPDHIHVWKKALRVVPMGKKTNEQKTSPIMNNQQLL